MKRLVLLGANRRLVFSPHIYFGSSPLTLSLNKDFVKHKVLLGSIRWLVCFSTLIDRLFPAIFQAVCDTLCFSVQSDSQLSSVYFLYLIVFLLLRWSWLMVLLLLDSPYHVSCALILFYLTTAMMFVHPAWEYSI